MYELNTTQVSKLVDNKTILITGGTGSFGNKLTELLLNNYNPKKVIIFSRDEFKQSEMQKRFSPDVYSNIRYFIGDVRDKNRLEFAFADVDIVFHAAALKQVPAIEYNPTEAIKTNIYGTENVVETAIKCGVKKVIGISTDKCVNPVNLYGATKLCLEKLLIAGNNLSGGRTQFSVLRYGNVFGSRGSVAPLFLKQKESGVLTLTEPNMTRFTLTLEEAINFVLCCACDMVGGEIFVPKLYSYTVLQLAKLVGKDCEIKITGIRPGEKMHEAMISDAESYLTIDAGDKYVVQPAIPIHDKNKYINKYGDKLCKSNWLYSSGENELIFDSDLSKVIDDYVKFGSL